MRRGVERANARLPRGPQLPFERKEPSVLVLVSPTVGVDVASKAVLLKLVDDARRDGMAVLLVSDDIEELRIATRLLVMVRGRIVREFRERPWNESDAIAAAEGLVA